MRLSHLGQESRPNTRALGLATKQPWKMLNQENADTTRQKDNL